MNTNSSGGELALLLTKDNGGTRISSTRHVHYGTITARRESSFIDYTFDRLLGRNPQLRLGAGVVW